MSGKNSEKNQSLQAMLIDDSNDIMAKKNSVYNERIAILIGIFTQFIWAWNTVTVKIANNISKEFSANNYSLWRSVGISILSIIVLRKTNTRITRYHEIKSKGWFLTRIVVNYFCYSTLISAIIYLRAATASCIGSTYPFVVIILSIVILKEKFYIRYLLGIIICFIGSAIIILNEHKGSAVKVIDEKENCQVLIGFFFAVLHVLTLGIVLFAQKMIVNEVTPYMQIFYIGLVNGAIGIMFCAYDRNFGLDLKMILLAQVNAGIFFLGIFYQNMALSRMDISKYAPIGYFCTLFVFLICMVLFGEGFYISDMIGSFMIVSFHFYNAWDPIKQGQ